MQVEVFKAKGCYTCGSFSSWEQPRIPLDEDNGNMPVRDPYLLCMTCSSEYPFPDIELLDDESWEYGRQHRQGALAIPQTYYKSEAQFNPDAMERGFLLQDEEDVPRPG